MKEIEVILNSSITFEKDNKLFLGWIKHNCVFLNQKGFIINIRSFNYDTASNDNINKLAQLKILKLPVLRYKNIIEDDTYDGIVKYLTSILQQSNGSDEDDGECSDDDNDELARMMLDEVKKGRKKVKGNKRNKKKTDYMSDSDGNVNDDEINKDNLSSKINDFTRRRKSRNEDSDSEEDEDYDPSKKMNNYMLGKQTTNNDEFDDELDGDADAVLMAQLLEKNN